MQIIKIADIELKVNEDNLLTTEEVAKYYGVTPQNIRTHKKQHSREIKESYHYIEKKSQKGTKKLYWTFEGLYIIGFFIRSKEAEKYRAYVSDFLAQIKQGNVQLRPQPNLLGEYDEKLITELIKRSDIVRGYQGQIKALENELAEKQSKIKNLELEIKNLKHQNNQIISQIPKIFSQEISVLEKMFDTYYQAMKIEIEHNLKHIKETDEFYQIGLTKIPKIAN